MITNQAPKLNATAALILQTIHEKKIESKLCINEQEHN